MRYQSGASEEISCVECADEKIRDEFLFFVCSFGDEHYHSEGYEREEVSDHPSYDEYFEKLVGVHENEIDDIEQPNEIECTVVKQIFHIGDVVEE